MWWLIPFRGLNTQVLVCGWENAEFRVCEAQLNLINTEALSRLGKFREGEKRKLFPSTGIFEQKFQIIVLRGTPKASAGIFSFEITVGINNTTLVVYKASRPKTAVDGDILIGK